MRILLMALLLVVTASSVCLAANKEWKEYKTDNFRIFAHQVDEDFINAVMTEAESALSHVKDNLGINRHRVWPLDKPVAIHIYKDEQDYIKNGCQAKWSHGVTIVEDRSIRTYPSASGFFDSILPHELGHIVLHEYLGMHIAVPNWFDEGVAQYQEKAKQLGSHKKVAAAVKNRKFIPLTELTNMRLYSEIDLDTLALFYAESASVVNFMITQSDDFHFQKLCRELKESRSFHDALTDAYPRIKSIEDLNKKWLEFLKDYE